MPTLHETMRHNAVFLALHPNFRVTYVAEAHRSPLCDAHIL